MAEESTAVATDTSTDIGNVSLDVMNEDSSTETSPAEDTAENESDEEQEQTPETDDTEAEAADTDAAEGEDTDIKAMSRRERAEFFRQQQEERQQRQQIEQAVNQAYQPQSVEDLQQAYLNQYPNLDEGTALMLARQEVSDQRRQIAEAGAQIIELNANLRVDTMEAQAKYAWMNPDQKDSYNKDLHDLAAQVFSQGITTDPNTERVVDARMLPSKAAEIVNKAYEMGLKKGSVKAQKAAEQQIAAVAPPTSTRQAVKQGNSLKDMEERLKDIKF